MAPVGYYSLPLLVYYSIILPSCSSFSTQKSFINHIQRHRPHHTHLYVSQASSSSSSSSGLSDDARLKRTSGLVKWAESCGAKIGAVEISKCNNGGGLGLQTTRSVKQNDILMEVPTDMVLQSGSSSKNNNPSIQSIGDSYSNAPWWAQLSIQINALSRSSDDNNDVSSWISTLPRSFNTPLHWSASTLSNDLQYPYLQRRIAIQRSQWTTAYDELQPHLPFPLSYDDFVWGCEMARSRAFSGSFSSDTTFNPAPFVFTAALVVVYLGLGLGSVEQAANGAGLVFCAAILKDFVFPKLFRGGRKGDNNNGGRALYVVSPLLDMANHDARRENAKVALEYFTGGYSLTSLRDLTERESVLISYGARSNDQLLQYYGFVERDNPNDVYIMPPLRTWDVSRLEEISGRTSFGKGRLEKLERAGLLGMEWTDEEADGIVVSRATGVDPAIMQALRALVSTDEEWKEAKESVGAFSVEFSEENELIARRVARKALEMELERMGMTVEEDERLLKQSQASAKVLSMKSEEELMAIQFRIEKKRVLLETIDKLL